MLSHCRKPSAKATFSSLPKDGKLNTTKQNLNKTL